MSQNPAENEEPLYATQGGGLATMQDGQPVWHEVPEAFPEFSVGEPVPRDWGLAPANAAQEQLAWEDEQRLDDPYFD